MQGIGAVVGGQGVLLALEGKRAALDPVAKAPDARAEIRPVGQPVRQRVKPVGEIGQHAMAVRHLHRHQDRPVLADAGAQAVLVGEGENIDFTSIGQIPEAFGGDGVGRHD